MAMIPRMAVLSCLEVVGIRVVRSNWTLRYAVHPVSLICVELTNTMPMDSGSIGLKRVGYMDSDVITPTGLNEWSRI